MRLADSKRSRCALALRVMGQNERDKVRIYMRLLAVCLLLRFFSALWSAIALANSHLCDWLPSQLSHSRISVVAELRCVSVLMPVRRIT